MINALYLRLMVFAARRLGLNIIVYLDSPEGCVASIHFATSERDLNTSIRMMVEALDASYKERGEHV